jgi:2-polyprenyl-3-methyl-5-hydroxy-6-metoxy-1,4-benzoquinol methylase
MPTITSDDLPELIKLIDELGGNTNDERLSQQYIPLNFSYATVVDEFLDPYSEEYLDQQVQLYREIANRPLNQETGELHPVDVGQLVGTANPLGSRDVNHIADYVRALATMLSLSDVGNAARVLDMGAGHGTSSEIFAFAGCKVHAIDIDPALGDLSQRRAAIRGLDIERSLLNFDNLHAIADGAYSAAYFFQSFHHCMRPWELINTLKQKLLPEGVIAFAGEPLQTSWWKNWGLRLDLESLYVARRFGWFESGWSHAFIRDCFERNEMTLTFFNGGLGGTEYGFATKDDEKRAAIVHKAEILGLKEVRSADRADLPQGRYHSEAGERTTLDNHLAFRQRPGAGGALFFGPYTPFSAGTYELSLVAEASAGSEGTLLLDVRSQAGTVKWFQEEIPVPATGSRQTISRTFMLPHAVSDIEFRAFVRPDHQWTVTVPTLRRASPAPE